MSAAPSASSQAQPDYPLSGITVLDLSHVYNGPYATFLMALAGADVIKIEPFHGEHLRSRGDMGGASLSFAMLNSNKKPVTLNLKTEKGRELLANSGLKITPALDLNDAAQKAVAAVK